MRILCTTKFLDGADLFEEGDIRTVDDERAQRFIDNAWAQATDGGAQAVTTSQQSVELDIHNVRHTTGDSNG